MNKDQVKGRVEEVKGKAKEIAGKISGNEELEQKGKIQNIGGKIQAGYGDVKEDVKKGRQGRLIVAHLLSPLSVGETAACRGPCLCQEGKARRAPRRSR